MEGSDMFKRWIFYEKMVGLFSMADIQSFHTAIEKGGDFMEKVILTYFNSEKIVISMGIS